MKRVSVRTILVPIAKPFLWSIGIFARSLHIQIEYCWSRISLEKDV